MKEFMSEDQVKSSITYKQLLWALWPYAKRHLGMLSATLLSVIAVAFFSRLNPTILGYAIDNGFLKKNPQVVQYSALAFFISYGMGSLAQFVYIYWFQKYGNRILYYIRHDLVSHTQSLPMNYFNQTPTGRIVTRLTNDTATLGEVFSDGVLNILTQSVVLLAIVISMLLISVKLTVITLISTPIFIYGSYRLSEKIRIILRESKKKLSTLNSYIAENISGIKVVQLYNRVERNRKHFTLLSQEYRDMVLSSIHSYALMQPFMNVFSALTIASALYFGGLESDKNLIPLGSLVAFFMHIQDFIHPLREILEKYQQFQNSLTSGERVLQLLDEPKESDTEEVKSPVQLKGQLLFNDLTFQYKPDLPVVLSKINLTVKPGESVALIGRTGSGKTTLISLLQRLYLASENTIFIDEWPIEKISLTTLRSRIGIVQQDNFIFRGTILENVSLNDPKISRNKVELALSQIGYDDLLKRTGREIDSKVEERGANLSVGERQLIAFARILAFEPDILILDEATANIDSETEKIIQAATKKVIKGRTSLIVAHRLSTIQDCDLIVVMENGHIKEQGPHQTLLQQKGYYYQVASAGLKSTVI